MDDYENWRERQRAARESWRAVHQGEEGEATPSAIRPPLFLISFVGVMVLLAMYVFLGGG